MIIPFLDGFLTFIRAPVTWLLILINVFFFSQNYQLSKDCKSQLSHWYQDQYFLHTQGQIYSQYSQGKLSSLTDSSTPYDPNAMFIQTNDMEMLGKLAFYDPTFLDTALKRSWFGDPVAIDLWKQDLSGFLTMKSYYPPVILGAFGDVSMDFFSMISYQFYHENLFHLTCNLFFILLVAGYLERRHSGLLIFSVYLLGGALAAFIHGLIQPAIGIPLVGASGSLSSLLGFLMVTHWRKKTRLFYFLLPTQKGMGFFWIPTCYWVIWLYVLEDVSGWLSEPSLYISGVAHRVHLFGLLVGCLMGFLYSKSLGFFKNHLLASPAKKQNHLLNRVA